MPFSGRSGRGGSSRSTALPGVRSHRHTASPRGDAAPLTSGIFPAQMWEAGTPKEVAVAGGSGRCVCTQLDSHQSRLGTR
jgi:hypothetical protein